MSYVLARPPSPSPRPNQDSDDVLCAALHAALRPFEFPPPPELSPHSHIHSLDMSRGDKSDKHPHLEIHVSSDVLCLRGTGVDVNPALLSGNVVLHLTEPTSIKEITLQFRGKARLPPSSAEPLGLSSSQLTYVVCNHEWSFLEGDRTHAHTLKAGRHLFPFQLQIGGSLPSSIYTSALGGASVQYKLRAHAVRGGFGLVHRDLAVMQPIVIMRSFGSEALEYQQTLEIENTWPEKLMYSLMIPHKAWAAGQKLSAVVKFQPLVKGARVLNVTTTINETIKLWARTGHQETTRVVASNKHDIIDGKAVLVDERVHRFRVPLLSGTRQSHSTNASTPAHTPAHPHAHQSNGTGSYFPPVASTSSLHHSPSHPHLELAPLTTTTSRSSDSSGDHAASVIHLSPHVSTHPSAHTSSDDLPPAQGSSSELLEQSSDVVTTLNIPIPIHATPSHSLEPIQVTHRVRWSILIGNLDGHTSELRCSLPIHVMDQRLAEEARAATLTTRRLLLGAADVEGGEAILGEQDPEADILPSYPSHVRDRVANAYLADSATMRVANAWVVNGISPTIPDRCAQTQTPQSPAGGHSDPSSGVQSPAVFETWQVGPGLSRPPPHSGHLPHEPQPGAHPLEWVNTELLLSLGREAPEAPLVARPQSTQSTPPSRTPPEHSAHGSRHGSRFPSRRGSRANSRASSPERSSLDLSLGSGGGGGGGADSPVLASRRSTGAASEETFVHSHSTASRNTHGLFQMAMKPFTSLTATFSLGGGVRPGHGHGHGSAQMSPVAGSGAGTPVHGGEQQQPMTSQEMLHHAFTQVPDYEMASRGFLGGGITPLSSLRDLPTYESVQAEMRAERSLSEGDLAGMFAAHGLGSGGQFPHRGRSALGRVPPRTAVVTPSG